jgi:hypothetical protein
MSVPCVKKKLHYPGNCMLYACRSCANGHVLYGDCMNETEDGLVPVLCTHGNYDDCISYEMCVSHTYSWMNRNNMKKKCSTCGKSSKPTMKNPFYYCKHCRLHQICTPCWVQDVGGTCSVLVLTS